MRYPPFLSFKLLIQHSTSDFMKPIIHQLFQAIVPAFNPAHNRHDLVSPALRDLTRLGTRPEYLSRMAYEWCSIMLEHHQSPGDRDNLLLLSLEIGFRHLDPNSSAVQLYLNHTEHHQGLVDVVVRSNDSEVVADLLHAWTFSAEPCPFLGTCAEHLVGLHDRVAFSPRLRRLVIRSVGFIGYEGFEGVGAERFCQLLDHLCVTVEDVGDKRRYMMILLGCLRSPGGIQHLSRRYWELLAEFATSEYMDPIYNPQITALLVEEREWDKLEFWMATVWMMWPLGNETTEEGLEHSTLLLFHQRPDVVQTLTLWMERWSERHSEEVPESFKRICQQAREVLQQDLT